MSFIPLKTQRNRGWWDGDRTRERGMRYLAPCAGVTVTNGVYQCNCATTTTTTALSDNCGRPFRPGSDYVTPTANGPGVTGGGRPRT